MKKLPCFPLPVALLLRSSDVKALILKPVKIKRQKKTKNNCRTITNIRSGPFKSNR